MSKVGVITGESIQKRLDDRVKDDIVQLLVDRIKLEPVRPCVPFWAKKWRRV